jgi:excisionase family DNA binding protein
MAATHKGTLALVRKPQSQAQHRKAHHKPPKPQRHYTDLPIHPTAEYLGRLQAAHLLGVNVQTIDQWIRDGKVRAYKPARRVLINREDLLKLVEAARV